MTPNPTKADTFLLVDDEAGILNALKRELHGWASDRFLKIVTASSAREGLKILKERPGEIAVICSDLKMPEMLGSDFLLQVRETNPEIVTILLTGFSEAAEVMKAVRAGIFSYILKPWDSEYLQSELAKAYEVYCVQAQNKAYAKAVEEELRWAGEMQKALLKPTLGSSEGVEFRTSYRPLPGLFVGGDYYDVLNLSPGRYLMLIGDVAGHGVRAAFITGILKAVIFPEYVRLMGTKRFSPAAFLSWLNDRMNFELRRAANLMISFFAGVLDTNEGSFTYANAGHCHPYIMQGKNPMALTVSGPGLGYASAVIYKEITEAVSPGDVIVLYTDGLVEPSPRTEPAQVVDLVYILGEIEYGAEYHRRILETSLAASLNPEFGDDVTLVTARIL